MGAGESTEAAPPEPTQHQQTTTATATQSTPVTTTPAAATATTTPATSTATSTSTSTAPLPTATTAPAPAPAPVNTLAVANSTSTAPTTSTTPSLKPSQLQLQAQAANVSSLELAPASVATSTTGTAPATATSTSTTQAQAHAQAQAPVATTSDAGADAHVAFEPYVLGDQESGLWYSLVEWCAPFLPDGIVLAWDEEQVAELVQAISGSEYFRSLLTKRHQERRARLKQQKENPSAPLPPQQHEFEIPYDRAEQILDVDKRLGKLRKEFVPSRISEDTFWYEYFLAVIQVIKAHVIGTQQHLRTQQIVPQAATATAAH